MVCLTAGTRWLQSILMLLTLAIPVPICSQVFTASPGNWLYPSGNAEATHTQTFPSLQQSFDSLGIKWSSAVIYGDVQPLVGNIVNNKKLIPANLWAPNEVVAVIGGDLVILGADGRLVARTPLPPYIKNVSVLFDSTAILPDAFTVFPVIMGLEVIEHDAGTDSVARSYIAGYSTDSNRIEIIKRLALDLRPYKPNNSASVSPFFGRTNGTDMTVYTTVNMSDPSVSFAPTTKPQYFRGVTSLDTRDFTFPFPRPDVLDDITKRYTVGPEITFAPPSITAGNGNTINILLPCFPSPGLNLPSAIANPYTTSTFPNHLYLQHLQIQNNQIVGGAAWKEITDIPVQFRPRVRPYYVHISDAGAGGIEKLFILVAEEYSGRDGSQGFAALHLYNETGQQLTFPPPAAQREQSSFVGERNHLWSVGLGDIDGSSANESLPYYPNNPGNEIVATQSSPDFAFANNKLFVLRYRTGARIPKPTTSLDSLFQLDTIATQRIGGWVAAVNDFDGAPDGKAEIFLVDGNTLRIMRMRDYNDVRFRLNNPFDTVFTHSFGGESITALVVSDVDGDGYNDILVTTSQSSYLLGKSLQGILDVIDPVVETNPPPSFCNGDTVHIHWVNYVGGSPAVNLYFQPYTAGSPSGARKLVRTGIVNTTDSVEYLYIVNIDSLSGDGRFIVQSTSNTKVMDSTAILRFILPNLTLDMPIDGTIFRIGDAVTLSGTATCLDSVLLQWTISRTDTSWQTLATVPIVAGGTFSYTYNVPCPGIFRCDTADIDSVIRYRAIGFQSRTTTRDTSASRTIIIRPDTLVIQVNPAPMTACPERMFMWSALPLSGCDTLTFSISTNKGKSFSVIDTIAAMRMEYTWKIPIDLPDTVLLRFCCQSGCARADIPVIGARPKYINIVAPNPFDPLNPVSSDKPGVSVVYTVPEQVTVTINIFDENNRLVAQPVKGEARAPGIVYCNNWNGYIEGGTQVAANGMYYISLELSNGKKEIYPVYVAKGY